MYEYKYLKISVDDKNDQVTKELNSLGEDGWELVNFQPSSETHGFLSNQEPWTTFLVFVFKRTKR